MTDWLGMAAHPRSPHPELKARVLGRALQRPRRIWPLAAAAAFLLAAGGGGRLLAPPKNHRPDAGRDPLSARPPAPPGPRASVPSAPRARPAGALGRTRRPDVLPAAALVFLPRETVHGLGFDVLEALLPQRQRDRHRLARLAAEQRLAEG